VFENGISEKKCSVSLTVWLIVLKTIDLLAETAVSPLVLRASVANGMELTVPDVSNIGNIRAS